MIRDVGLGLRQHLYLGFVLQEARFSGKAGGDDLLDADRVAVAGPIITEVLFGMRRKDEADWVSSRLRLAHYVEANRDDWRAAAAVGRELA